MYYIGFDIGGSSVKAVILKRTRKSGRIKILKEKIKNLPSNFKGLLELLNEIVVEFSLIVKSNKIAGIGLALAGTLDKRREKMLNSPNIRYLNNKPLKRLFELKLKYPVKIENDVNCYLLAESKIGLIAPSQILGRGKNVFYLTLGSGIGGALMVDGKIILGAHGAAGEVGHMLLKLKIDECLDLEELASNKFIMRSLGIGSIEAERKARAGDKKAKKVFNQLSKNLGIGIANIINIFDPEAIILSGGLSLAKNLILPGIKKEVKKYVTSPAAKKTKILFSRLGRFGGAIGATFLFK